MSAYFATVFRLTWSTLAISDLERPGASIDRISFTVSRGTVISSILPGRARQSNRPGKPYGEGRAPDPRGAAPLLKLLNFSCSRCSFPSDHSDHFLVNINKMARHRGRGVDLSVPKLCGAAARTVRTGSPRRLPTRNSRRSTGAGSGRTTGSSVSTARSGGGRGSSGPSRTATQSSCW